MADLMDDENTTDTKRKNLGMVHLSKIEKKLWTQYEESSKAFALQKTKSSEAKKLIKQYICKKSKELSSYDPDDIDFIQVNDKLQIFRKAQKGERKMRGHELDLS